jgi:nucleoside-triphosphatase THEP1
MAPNNIYIFTDAIHTGKTTILQNWLKEKGINAGGILTPDRDEKRWIYDISRDEWHTLQVEKDHPLPDSVVIGKFRFSRNGFKKAQEILLRSVQEDPDWVIVDEVGMLELHRKTGLEPSISEIINIYKSGKQKGKLLLVIRNYLVEETIDMFGLDFNLVKHKSFFL